jgi:predicted ThiF/HesA family dinucleotide-utilizing enzyme
VIAGGDYIDAKLEEFAGNGGCDTVASGGVFAIGDDEVEAMAVAQDGHEATDGAATGFADDVANEQDFHGVNTGDRGPWVQLSVIIF